jgi:hypothetical protein
VRLPRKPAGRCVHACIHKAAIRLKYSYQDGAVLYKLGSPVSRDASNRPFAYMIQVTGWNCYNSVT